MLLNSLVNLEERSGLCRVYLRGKLRGRLRSLPLPELKGFPAERFDARLMELKCDEAQRRGVWQDVVEQSPHSLRTPPAVGC
jgi:hypothetical protein